MHGSLYVIVGLCLNEVSSAAATSWRLRPVLDGPPRGSRRTGARRSPSAIMRIVGSARVSARANGTPAAKTVSPSSGARSFARAASAGNRLRLPLTLLIGCNTSSGSMTFTRTDRGATIGASTINATACASCGSFVTASSSDGTAWPSAAMPYRCSAPAAARRASSRTRHRDPAGTAVHVSLAHVVRAADSSRPVRRRRSRPATPSVPAPRTGGPPRSCARSPARRRSPCRWPSGRQPRRAGVAPRSS